MSSQIFAIPIIVNAGLVKSVTYSFKQSNGSTTTYTAMNAPFALVSAFLPGTPHGYQTVVTVTAFETNFTVPAGANVVAPKCEVKPNSFVITNLQTSALVETCFIIQNSTSTHKVKTFGVQGTTTIHTHPTNGTVAFSENGLDIIYTPNVDFVGNDSYQYIAPNGNVVTVFIKVLDIALPTANVFDEGSLNITVENQYEINCPDGVLTETVFTLYDACPGANYMQVLDTVTIDENGESESLLGLIIIDAGKVVVLYPGQYIVGNTVTVTCDNPNFVAGVGACVTAPTACNPIAFEVVSPEIFSDTVIIPCVCLSLGMTFDADIFEAEADISDTDNAKFTFAFTIHKPYLDLTSNVYKFQVLDTDGNPFTVGTTAGTITAPVISNNGLTATFTINAGVLASFNETKIYVKASTVIMGQTVYNTSLAVLDSKTGGVCTVFTAKGEPQVNCEDKELVEINSVGVNIVETTSLSTISFSNITGANATYYLDYEHNNTAEWDGTDPTSGVTVPTFISGATAINFNVAKTAGGVYSQKYGSHMVFVSI